LNIGSLSADSFSDIVRLETQFDRIFTIYEESGIPSGIMSVLPSQTMVKLMCEIHSELFS
jgi:hypothetical protein